MKKNKITLFCIILFLCLSLKNEVFSKQENNIAIVDIEKIVEDANCSKDAKEKLENKKKSFENSIRGKEQQLREEQEDIESKASILSQTKLQQKREEFQKKVMEFQQEVSEKSSKLQEEFNIFLDKLKNEITIILKNDKYKTYSIILNSAIVIHNNNATDITQEIIKDLNKKKISL